MCIFECNTSTCDPSAERCMNTNNDVWFRNYFSVYLEVPMTRTDEPYYMCARFVLLTLILLAGLVGNTLTLVVMIFPSTRQQQISSRFATLAFCDLCCCLTRSVTWIGMIYVFLGQPPPLRFTNDHWCRFVEYCFASLHVAESWLVAFITMERAIVVVNPMKGGDICGQSVGRFCLYFCMCGPFVILSYIPFITKYVPGVGCAARIFPDMFCHFLISTIAISEVPLTLIFVCNITIIVFLKRQNMKVNSEKRNRKFKRATNMVLAVSLAFLATVFPSASNSMMKVSNPNWGWLRVSDDVTDVLLDLNYAINFYLYVITGKSMRRELRNLFLCCWLQKGKSSDQALHLV